MSIKMMGANLFSGVIFMSSKIPSQKMSLTSVILLALNSLIGSGWLFGAGEAARIAGPAAVISWILGAIIIMVIAFN